jgi:hypothetical protein
VERLDLRDHDGFERCVRHKATLFRALHLFLKGCERQLVNPVIALAIVHQPWGQLTRFEPSMILSRTAGRRLWVKRYRDLPLGRTRSPLWLKNRPDFQRLIR